MVRRIRSLSLVFCFLMLAAAHSVLADDGHPVAIRYWPGGGVTIETNWDLHIGLRLDECRNRLARVPDLEIRLDEMPEGATPRSPLVHVWPPQEKARLLLDRKPNLASPAFQAADSVPEPTAHAITFSRAGSVQSSTAREAMMMLIEVDGLRLLDIGGVTATEFSVFEEMKWVEPGLDALLFSTPPSDMAALAKIAERIKPRVIVLPAGSETALADDVKTGIVPHNTLALSAGDLGDEGTRFIVMGHEPWHMEGELSELFARKEAACGASRQLFASLSSEQMNFRPGDGTHTPRWNAEHMMGRELGFFSQIYHALEPSIPVMDLNPKQMPDEYQAAHPDWSGAEEARQMERVEAFTRRFAYVLCDLDLERRAPGSRMWSPRSLLQQMERHYGEHTANVEKKKQLPDWPGQ